ncbi:MAG: hypothetical protein DME70_10285, partial [Verrucomicrobia bacterium]
MRNFICVALAVCATTRLFAQSPPSGSTPATTAEVEALREEVKSLKEMVQTLQQQVKDQQSAKNNSNAPALPENPEPQTAETASSPAPSASAPPLFPTTDTAVVTSAPSVNANGTSTFPTTDESVTTTPSSVTTTDTSSSLTQPIPIIGGGNNKNYMNISFDGMFALAASSDRHLDRLEVGDHDPLQRGFNGRNAEIALDGAVDPYFEGFANIVLKLDNNNQTEIELEEAFLQTTNLPYGLQIKAGQFFDAFGRINPTHPHTWEFADSPLVNGRLLGGDGLRGVGAQLAWALPVPWYAQFIFAVQNGRGGTAYSFRNPGDDGVFYDRTTINRDASALHDMLYVPRLETSF